MTHPPRSFIDVPADSHFPIQNLPYGVFSPPGERARVGVALGEWVVDLAVLEAAGLLGEAGTAPLFDRPALNGFMAQGRTVWGRVRARLGALLGTEEGTLRDDAELRGHAFHRMADVTLHLPAEVGDYTDFYSSRDHATNVGIMFRGKDNALMPNWLHLPIGYHGRSSSLVPSGTGVRRPQGQTNPTDAPTPIFGPSRQLDFELEMGALVGPGNVLGEPVPIGEAAEHLFGFVLVNDWSARDIQRWEYQPLGPFLAKNFATSLSPWVVTVEALEPFRVAGPVQEPEPLPYLRSTGDWHFEVQLDVLLQSPDMDAPLRISRSNFRHLYWSVAQQLAHHTITGCNLRPGDLLASGTISGPDPDSYGSLLELTWRGTKPIALPTGDTRTFLQDGDRLTLTGWAQGDGFRVGFGEVTGVVLPAGVGQD